MFRFEPTIHQLPVEPEALVYLAESSNQPHVAVPGRKAQGAQANILALRNSPDTCWIYISLRLLADRELAVWVHEATELPLSLLQEVAEEAWLFCESMGFIMDVVPFDSRSASERAAILDRLRRSEGDAEASLPPAATTAGRGGEADSVQASFTPSPADLARLGRLLSSF